MTDRFTHDAAPYVLGALPPEDRRAFEEHLPACPDCQAEVREFAGLPGLLSRLPAAEVPAVLEGEPTPAAALPPSLLARVRGERRARRWRSVAVGAVAACLAAFGTGVVVAAVDRPPTGAARAFERVAAGAPVSAEATVSDVAEGTRIDMTCRYEGMLDGRARAYTLRVIPKGGTKPVVLGEWPVLSTEPYRVGAVAPLRRDQIDRFELTNAAGRVLLKLTP